MPYKSVEEALERFPKLRKYPEEAQAMFLKVVNAALKQYPDDEGKAIATAWTALYRKYGRRDMIVFQSAQIMSPFTEADGIMRIPTVFTKEGVMNGGHKPWDDGGPGKYGLKNSASTFEGKPVIYWHPPSRRPAGDRDQIIGWCSDVVARDEDRTIHGITNIKVEGAPPQFIENIRKGENREGSIGYWSDDEYIPGRFGGDDYDRVEWNVRADHYAVGIPRGACSVIDGCGLGFDEMEGIVEAINLDDMEGEGIVCLSRLKEFLLDTFRRNRKAPADAPWEFNGADYDLAQLKKASAVVTGDGNKGEDCLLPHHKPDGTVVWRGVEAASATLIDGDDEISPANRAEAMRHLTRHYGEFRKETPWTKGDQQGMDMKLNEEERTAFEKRISDLTTEKLELEGEKATLLKDKTDLEGEKVTWETEKDTLTEERDGLKTYKEETEPKLKSYVDAEELATEKQRDELIVKIAKVTGEEDAEVVKEKYEDWSVDQLAHFEATLIKSTDRSPLGVPTTIGPDGKPVEVSKTSMEVQGTELTVGSLHGKKPGET